MFETSKHRRRRTDRDPLAPHQVVPGRRAAKDRRKPPNELLLQVEADLQHSKGLLRFSESVEARFQQAREPGNTRHFVWSCLVGLALYNMFLLSDRFMVPDVLDGSARIHAVVTVLGLLVTFLVHRRRLGVESMGAVLLMMVGNTMYTSCASHAPDAVFLPFVIPILIIFGNIVLPLPFQLAVGFSLVSAGAVSWAIWIQPLDLGTKVFATLLEISVGIYTLIATYRLERGERQAFLLTLRETLRGETLVQRNRELSELSETDGLTRIPNRRVFDRTLEQLWKEHLQSRTPLALLMIDIDHFKRLNDTHGHANGDVCLRKVADRLHHLMRPHQSLARYGGEEFVVLLEGEGAFQAVAVAERLRQEIEAMPIELAGEEDQQIRITISTGCATMIPTPGAVPADLFSRADSALYTAKRHGRNRVEVHTGDAPEPKQDTKRVPSPLTAIPAFPGN